MFERFTDRARRVVVLAQEEARMLNHNYIGTEHVLLGLIHEGQGIAARALNASGVAHDTVRSQVLDIVGRGLAPPTGHIPFTPRAKKVLEFSLREALALQHNYIGTEHILLGAITEGEGVAAQCLARLGVGPEALRAKILEILSDPSSADAAPEAAVARGEGHMTQVLFGVGSAEDAPGPRCGRCHADLGSTARTTVAAVPDESGQTDDLTFLYCASCGWVVQVRWPPA